MIIVSKQADSALKRVAASSFVDRATRWLTSRPELSVMRPIVTHDWMHEQVEEAERFGIQSEDAVSRFARLRLMHDAQWFSQPEQQEILTSNRPGNLKTFQLECRSEGIADSDGPTKTAAHA